MAIPGPIQFHWAVPTLVAEPRAIIIKAIVNHKSIVVTPIISADNEQFSIVYKTKYKYLSYFVISIIGNCSPSPLELAFIVNSRTDLEYAFFSQVQPWKFQFAQQSNS